MATDLNVQAWDKTPALNDNSDSTIGDIDDDIAPNTLDDKQRGIMAAIARYIDDVGGALEAGGTANALTVTTNQGISASHLTDGYALVVRAADANTSGTVTIAVDSLSAVAIKTADGGNPDVGQITDEMFLLLFYDGTNGYFRAANLNTVTDTSSLGAVDASFLAHKNGTSQTISSSDETAVTFGTESYDVGSYYNTSTSRWTPPAGYALINASVIFTASPSTTPDRYTIKLMKNGSLHRQNRVVWDSSASFSASLSTIESVNGTDYFSIAVDAAFDNSYSVSGTVTESWFSGTMV